ncbi:MAG: MATE family efflux transporter [Clostridiales bacterium]|nr:MATE family efflux transporter [Clostridiales bacterium]
MSNELFEKAPIHKAYFSLTMPLVCSMVLSLVYNMVDTYFIAQTGNTNLVAGVSLCAPIFSFLIALGDILGLGGSSVIARLLGKKQDEDGKRLSVFCFYGALLGGIVTAAALLLLQQPLLSLLGADAETLPYASQYYGWLALGAPFIILSYTPSNLLRTEGFVKASMAGTVSGSIVNIILDPIFIFTLGMGAGGAAIATVLGNICADLFFVVFLLTKSEKLSVNPVGFHISASEIRQIFAIGLPASVTNFMQSIGIALTNRFLLAYGNDKVAAMGIVMKINMIAVLILVALAFGAQPMVGYNYGAGNRARLKKVLTFSYQVECGTAVVLAAALSLLARPLTGLFVSDEALIQTGVVMLRMQQAGMLFVAIVLETTCTFQSAGKAVCAFLLSVSRQGVIFAIVISAASGIAGYNGVLAAQPLSDLLTAVLAVVLYRRCLSPELEKAQVK